MRFMKSMTCAALALTMAACGAKSDKAQDSQKVEPTSAEATTTAEPQTAAIPAAAMIRVPVNAAGEAVGEPEMRVLSTDTSALDDSNVSTVWESGAAPQKVISSTDELDSDSSTQSWFSWSFSIGWGTRGCGDNCGNPCRSNCGGYENPCGNNCGGYNNCGNNCGGYNNCGNNCGGYNNCGNNCGGHNNCRPRRNCGVVYPNPCNTNCGGYAGYNQSYWMNTYRPVMNWQGQQYGYGQNGPGAYNQGGYNYYNYPSAAY